MQGQNANAGPDAHIIGITIRALLDLDKALGIAVVPSLMGLMLEEAQGPNNPIGVMSLRAFSK
jgi:hypothetical protein